MTFLYLNYAPLLAVVLLLWVIIWIYDYKRYFHWLKDCFNLAPNFSNILSKLVFILSVILVCAALLDLRGPEQQIETPLSDQKTIILIDASSSMLVEDVQPSRFKRALTVARHFVKNAVGHQISINVFSDISKRLIPFTDDIDLLDARLAGLEDERLRGGGSNIGTALAETVEALKRESSNGKAGGNILLITDAEENGVEFQFEASPGISLALVGVGTLSGGKIPMRTKKGTFSGYKTYMNKEVVSKLDEAYLDKIASLFSRSKKWIVLSFNIPTEEILNYFREGATSSEGVDQNKIRPVRSQWLMGAGLLLYILSVLITQLRGYSTLLILFASLFFTNNYLEASDEAPVASSALQDDWSPTAKQELALKFAKSKELEKAELLYKEAGDKLSLQSKANLGASLLAQGKAEGLDVLYEVLKNNSGKDVELERTIHANVKKYLTSDGGKGGKGKDEGEDKKNDKKENGDKGNSGDESKDSQGKDGESKDEESKNNESDEKKETKNNKITNMAQREREIDRKRRMMKVPALLKQLMQDDRALQSEFIDTATQDRDQSRQKKDW